MSENVGPIYEVTLSVDREIIDELDVWLTEHVDEMLQIPGFVRASIFAAEDDDQGRPQRVTHYYLETDADLENYLAGPAEVMRRSATERFTGRFTASRRVLHNADMLDGALKPLESCLNWHHAWRPVLWQVWAALQKPPHQYMGAVAGCVW